MNLPNQLSFGRILSIPVFLALALLPPAYDGLRESGESLIPALLFSAAFLLAAVVTATDWFDGYLARKYNLVTPLGKLLDPLADKIFVTAALVVLVHWSVAPAWAVVIIISREFLVTGMRQLASEANASIPSDRLGKHKTGWQLALILTGLCWLTVREIATYYGAGEWFIPGSRNELLTLLPVYFVIVVTLALTVVSGWNYIKGNSDLLTEAPPR